MSIRMGPAPAALGQASNTFLPVWTRTPTGRVGASRMGMFTATTVFNGTVDPIVALGYYPLAGTFTATADGTAVLSAVSDFTGLVPGMGLSAGGVIPAGATIQSVNPGASTVTMTAPATGPAAGVTVTATDYTSALQLEADWDCGPTAGRPHITEWYWQVTKPDGSSRRPIYSKYDRTLGRAISWDFLIGNGVSDTGVTRPVFAVNWDNDTQQVGTNCFSVAPNRINLYGVASGGIAATQTRLCMYSAAGQGSAISLSFNGADPEGTANPTTVWQAVASNQMNMHIGGQFSAEWYGKSATSPVLRLLSGITLGDGAIKQGSMWSTTGAPSNAMGANGDFCMRIDTPTTANQRIYVKSAGAWVGIL
jgi:hypothetical protein